MAQGSIVKYSGPRGTRYRVRIDLGVDPRTGKRRQRMKTFVTRKEAERYIREQFTQRDRGVVCDPAKTLVGDYLHSWLEHHARHAVKPTSWEAYEGAIRLHLVPWFGDTILTRLNAPMIERVESERLRDGDSRHLVRKCHRLLKQALAHAVRLGLLASNPATNVSPPRSDTTGRMPWTVEQAMEFLEARVDDPLRPLWYVALTTGMRRGELLGLRWADVDFERGALMIRQQVVPVAGHAEIVPRTKGGKGRNVDLDDGTAAVLRAQHVRQQAARLRAGRSWQKFDLVFSKPDGSPYQPTRVSQLFRRACDACDLPRIRLHDCRHTSATVALALNIHPKVVSERLGHASMDQTTRTYSHVFPTLHRAAARTIGEAFSPACATIVQQ